MDAKTYFKGINYRRDFPFEVYLNDVKGSVFSNIFVADTETSSYLNYKKEGRVRVILWGIESLDGSLYFQGTTGESLVRCLEFIAVYFKKPRVYFHNAKYDWSYIAPILLNKGYYTSSQPDFYEYENDGQKQRVKRFHPQQIDVMRSVRGIFYKARIQVKKKAYVSIIDSMKFYPGPLSTYGDIFRVKKLYGDFDYEKYRPLDYKFTTEEMLYFKHDIEILRRMIERKEKDGKKELTRAGYAYNELVKQTLLDAYNNGSVINKIIKQLGVKLSLSQQDLLDANIHANYKVRNAAVLDFAQIFPETPLSFRGQIVDAYSGGFVWYDKEHPLIGKGVVYDCNSEYPAAMMKATLPYGPTHQFSGSYIQFSELREKLNKEGKDAVAIFKFKAKFTLKKDTKTVKFFPVLPKKYSSNGEFVYSDKDLKARFDDTLTLTNFDLMDFFRNYDVTSINFLTGYWWFAAKGLFKGFVKSQAAEKVKQTKGRDACIKWLKDNQDADPDKIEDKQSELAEHKLLRSESKQTLNSGYGKFAQSQVNPSTTMQQGSDGIVRYETLTNSKYDLMEELEGGGKCFPVGIFITAGARQILYKAMYAANKRVRYIDTDSVHLEGQGPVENMDCDQSRLGAWKVESRFDKGHYLRAKSYEEYQTFPTDKNGKPFNKVTLAGFDEAARRFYFKDFGHLDYGKYGTVEVKGGKFTVENGTQTTEQVPGGTLIIRRPKQLSNVRKTSEAKSEIQRAVNFNIYKASFWNAWYYALDNNDLAYFEWKLWDFESFLKEQRIELRAKNDTEHPYREIITENPEECFKQKAFLGIFDKLYKLSYNTNEEAGLI